MDEEDTEPMLRRQHILGQLDGVQRYHPFVLSVQHIISGWWFGTFFLFHNIWDNPSHWLSYFPEGWLNHQPDILGFRNQCFLDFSARRCQILGLSGL